MDISPLRPGSNPQSESGEVLQELMASLEARTRIAYQSRLAAFKRISARGQAWNAALVALSTSSTIAALGCVRVPKMYGEHSDILLVAISIFALAVSLTVTSVDYPSRAVRMEANYKAIERLSYQVQAERHCGAGMDYERYIKLNNEYLEIIANSENHTGSDYDKFRRNRTAARVIRFAGSHLPYLFFVPTAVIIGVFIKSSI